MFSSASDDAGAARTPGAASSANGGAPSPSGGSPGDWVGAGVSVAAIAFLAFVAGAMVMLTQSFPSEFLRNSYRAAQALIAQREMTSDPLGTDLWVPARTDAKGVTINLPGETMPGYTLYTSGDGPYARLIDQNGRVVHEWRKPFSAVWHEGAAVKEPQQDSLIYMRKAKVLPNGDLLAIYIAGGDTPWGYGLVKLDRHSNVIWSFLEQTHHDIDIAPDGRIFVLTHEFVSEPVPGFDFLGSPRLDDFLVVLSPDGQVLKKISLTHAMVDSPYAKHLYAMPALGDEDPLHTNAARYVDAEAARQFPAAREGQVLTSFRSLGLVALVDLESETITWALRGPWLGQHDPRILPGGRLLLFDNAGAQPARDGTQRSRVMEFDPATMEIKWSYSGSDEKPFFSGIRGASERQPNGNTLISESDGGRLLEINRAGKIVWEFVNPVRLDRTNAHIPVVSWGQRISPEALDESFRAELEQKP